MIGVGQRALTRRAIPDLDSPVGVGRGHIPSVRGPGYPIHPPAAAIQPQEFPRGRVPDLHRLIKAHRGDLLSVRGPGDRSHNAQMTYVGQQGPS